jgi:hypothetical protein
MYVPNKDQMTVQILNLFDESRKEESQSFANANVKFSPLFTLIKESYVFLSLRL